MNKQEVFSYVEQAYATLPEFPWQDDNAVLRRADNHKWYALIMTIPGEKLGLSADMVDILNVKCDPVLVASLRTQEGYRPAYHMNKERWLTILLDCSVPDESIQQLIDLSYELTAPKRRPKKSTNHTTV